MTDIPPGRPLARSAAEGYFRGLYNNMHDDKQRRPRYRAASLCLGPALLGLALAGCGDDDDGAASIWEEPSTLRAGADEGRSPQIAVNSAGHARAVWQEVALDTAQAGNDVYQQTNIWAARFDPVSGEWGGVSRLQTGDSLRTLQSDPLGSPSKVADPHDARPQIAIDTSGNAMAVWEQLEQVSYDPDGNPGTDNDLTRPTTHVWAADFDATTGQWGSPTQLDNLTAATAGPAIAVGDPLSAEAPALAMDPNGSVMAVWLQWSDADDDGNGYPDNRRQVYAARYAGGAWGAPARINADSHDPGTGAEILGAADATAVGVDRNGNAMAAWRQFNAAEGRYLIYARRYDQGSGTWDAVAQISDGSGGTTPPDGGALAPAVSMNGDGQVLVVWSEWDDVNSTATTPRHNRHIYANRYVNALGWATPARISDPTSPASNRVTIAAAPRVAVDENGNGMAVWSQHTLSYSVTNLGGGNYLSENLISQPTNKDIWVNRFDPATGWGSDTASGLQVLVEPAQADAIAPRIAVYGNSGFLVAWRQWSGPLEGSVFNIRSRNYTTAGWGPSYAVGSGARSNAELSVSSDGAGNVWAAWSAESNVDRDVRAARLKP